MTPSSSCVRRQLAISASYLLMSPICARQESPSQRNAKFVDLMSKSTWKKIESFLLNPVHLDYCYWHSVLEIYSQQNNAVENIQSWTFYNRFSISIYILFVRIILQFPVDNGNCFHEEKQIISICMEWCAHAASTIVWHI